MKALLLIAHGSRRAESNDEIRELAGRVAAQATGQFDHIDCAFLELAEPSIPQGIQAMVDKGSESIVVMPYFLANGMHVAKDIPAFLKEAGQQFPNVEILDAASKAD